MDEFIISMTAILSIFIGVPLITVGGVVFNRFLKNKQRELDLREREIALEERQLALDEQAYNQTLPKKS